MMNSNESGDALLEDIRNELQGGFSDLSNDRAKTIKYYICDMHSHVKKLCQLTESQVEQEISSMRWSLGVTGFLALVLLLNSLRPSQDFTFINPYLLVLNIFGVVLSIIYLSGSLEHSTLWRSLWSLTSARWIVYIIFTAMVLVASGRAASQVNGVFGIDATLFPHAYALTTALVLFKLTQPWLLGVALFVIFVNVIAAYRGIRAVAEDYNLWALLSPGLAAVLGLIVIYVVGGWANNELSNDRLYEKIYLMAQALDFNGRHNCTNIPGTSPVIFLGPTQERVLVAPSALPPFGFTTFFTTTVTVPEHFEQIGCVTGVISHAGESRY